MKKTILTFLLLVIMPFSMLAYDVYVGKIYYNVDESTGTAEVTFKSDSYNSYTGKVVIPATFYDPDSHVTYTVTSIGDNAFRSCSNLTSVTIPEGVTRIGEWAFYNCTGLTSIIVDDGNSSYISEEGVLFDKDMKSLLCFPAGKTQSEYTIPESVTYIYPHAFERCSSLISVTISDNVTIIGKFAFRASGLTSITIPNSVTTIGEKVFLDCTSLTSVTIPTSVTTIGWGAFANCSGLTSVTIPSNVTTIGGEAFSGCSNLTSVTVEMETPLTITENTFTNRANATLYVPAGCKTAYEAAQYWQDFNIVEMASVAPGDVNGDGDIDINDVMALVSHICGQTPTQFDYTAADANGDGEIDINDVMRVVDTIVNQ